MIGLKVWAYIILAGILITALSLGIRSIYKAGYDKAVLEQHEATDKAVEAARIKFQADMDDALAKSKDETKAQQQIVEVERVVERKIPTVVTKIVHDHPDCADLGPDFLRIYNDAIAPNTESSTEAVTKPAG